MSKATRNQALSDLSLEVFRLTARLNTLADRLSRQVGLSSARWQLLGALALAGQPLPVAEIARRMGLKRQSVQRTADALEASGHIEYLDNPRHRRAKLAAISRKGEQSLDALQTLQDGWAEGLEQDFDLTDLEQTLDTLRCFRALLDQSSPGAASESATRAHSE